MIEKDTMREVVRTLSQNDFDRFANLSGDHNPIHVDPEFSTRTRFGRTVAHGLLLNTVLRGLLDELVPGFRQLTQELVFPAPTYADEPMRFRVCVENASGDEVLVGMSATRVADGVITCEGKTTLGPPRGEQ